MYRPGRHNDVADVLSRKVVEEFVTTLTLVESSFLERVHEFAESDPVYKKLTLQVKDGEIRKYWLKNGLLFAKESRAYVPVGALRRELLGKTHDLQWARHLGVERMYALLS